MEAEDLLAAAGKLGARPEEIQELLRRSGFTVGNCTVKHPI